MHILLPPSETKRAGGTGLFDASLLTNSVSLAKARSDVKQALEALSENPEVAVKALKLGVKNRDELEGNLQLDVNGVMPAVARYTGVLYDALDVHTLSESARSWVDGHVSIQSALFGLVAASDLIPAYRLSGSTRLPALSGTLKKVWSEAHAQMVLGGGDWVLDLRSKDYAALAPLPDDVGSWLHIVQRNEHGEVRALNHFNKAAKGYLVRKLAETRASVHSAAELLDWAKGQDLEMIMSEESAEITLVTTLGAPNSSVKR